MSRAKPLRTGKHRLTDFSAPVVVEEFRDYTWVLETREIDAAGTPYNEEWEVWTSFLAGNKVPAYPEKNRIIASYLKEIRQEARDNQRSIEYRIKLICNLEQELDVAVTESWRAVFEDEVEDE